MTRDCVGCEIRPLAVLAGAGWVTGSALRAGSLAALLAVADGVELGDADGLAEGVALVVGVGCGAEVCAALAVSTLWLRATVGTTGAEFPPPGSRVAPKTIDPTKAATATTPPALNSTVLAVEAAAADAAPEIEAAAN